jgi:hypothetical protein
MMSGTNAPDVEIGYPVVTSIFQAMRDLPGKPSIQRSHIE